MVRRVYVEKKQGFRTEAEALRHDLKHNLNLTGLTAVRVLYRYDIEGLSEETYRRAVSRILSEAPVDTVYEETVPGLEQEGLLFAVEYLPGQYDQRADSAEQCIRILKADEAPVVRYAKVIVLKGDVDQQALEAVKAYTINAVDSREADLAKPESLDMEYGVPADVAVVEGFCNLDDAQAADMVRDLGLAMSLADLKHTQAYFRDVEKRDPTITEIRVLDTYWSDHCRHTTFSTVIENVEIEDTPLTQPLKAAFAEYQEGRKTLGREDKPFCLMDIALAAMRELKKNGQLIDQEDTDEINACSIVIPVDVDGKEEEWLLQFKNETHNHPTEIEPFGGAATCLGGAIRDPLSGRSYVYQAMRLTGGADPTVPVGETLHGKLPQKKITREAAKGYSSYGNQIGLATGYVKEIYHPGYMAKHMELGAVIAATPRDKVTRLHADPGDVVILLGGRTGRDGIGGATGSSKAHTETSLDTCGAEVQKGNAPTERKLQRLFRNEEASRMIKICNDFGAGGVSVAIGELAPGLDIQLDAVPKKYAGLDGTELAISESQERMAVVLDPKDMARFMELAAEENLEATQVAVVTEEPRLVMHWRGSIIVDMARSFLDTNGAPSYTNVVTEAPAAEKPLSLPEKEAGKPFAAQVTDIMGDLAVSSQKGLVEMFDSSIGASTVLMPYGGKYQQTPIQTMAAKIPVGYGETTTASLMAYGYDPFVTEWSPFHGAMYAVLESTAKIAAAGGDYKKIHFTFQEYFERLDQVYTRWGKPFAALLGAYKAQKELGLASIGGKDSMSGSFGEMHVPPTLISLAVAVADAREVLSPEFKNPGSQALLLTVPYLADGTPDWQKAMALYELVHAEILKKNITAAYAIGAGGVLEAIVKMALGNHYGFKFNDDAPINAAPVYGSLVVEAQDAAAFADFCPVALGCVTEDGVYTWKGETVDTKTVLGAYEGTLERIYRTRTEEDPDTGNVPLVSVTEKRVYQGDPVKGKPRAFLPVFPGTNCEYDTARAFARAGAEPDIFVFRNQNEQDILYSIEEMKKRLDQAQILMLSGGFSAGDEPEGSGKFIATVFSNPQLMEATMRLLNDRDGLILGICNGFQALIKLGLVPYGEIRDLKPEAPTLTYNTIGRHASCMVQTRVVSNRSPWLSLCAAGDVHTIPISHGEGRFIASPEMLEQLKTGGQIATQYVDLAGQPTMDTAFNPNGSLWAIEGITSPDGRVLGKMGHTERIGDQVAKNVPGAKDQKIFRAGVQYFL